MLQQTQVETVIPYFERFLRRFPDVATLARAPLDAVLKQWEGLGYYSRARQLQKAAQVILVRWKGRLPERVEELETLPGIGRYTAGAIASIAFGVSAPVVDCNVARVLSRVLASPTPVRDSGIRQELWATAESLVARKRPGDYNQALMELGACVCRPRRPLCDSCPVRTLCRGFASGHPERFPLSAQRRSIPLIRVSAGIIWNRAGERILISRRPEKGLLGGLWEFPGGKIERGETPESCLRREIIEELGIRVEVGPKFMEVRHAYSHRRVRLLVFHCRYTTGRPQRLGVSDWRWVRLGDLAQFAFPSADIKVLERLAGDSFDGFGRISWKKAGK